MKLISLLFGMSILRRGSSASAGTLWPKTGTFASRAGIAGEAASGDRHHGPIRLLAAVGGILALLPGCPEETQTPGISRKSGFIAVVGADRNDAHWPVFEAAAQADWVGRLIRAEAPPTRSANLQGQLIRRLRDEGMRGLCVEVVDAGAMSGLLEQLRSSGVPVVTMLAPVISSSTFPYAGIDADKLSRALVAALFEHLSDEDTIGVLSDRSSDWLQRVRVEMLKEIATRPTVSVLRDLDCGGDAERAVELLAAALEKYPGIDGWVSLGDWPYRGAAGEWALPPLITPGPFPNYGRHISEGHCRAMIVPDYAGIVRRAVEICDGQVDQEVLQVETYYAPSKIITADNLAEFEKRWSTKAGRAAGGD
jgi:ABC-type sugar transport system substrate-binding protein